MANFILYSREMGTHGEGIATTMEMPEFTLINHQDIPSLTEEELQKQYPIATHEGQAITCDGFGQIYAAGEKLSKNIWLDFDVIGISMRVEPAPPYKPPAEKAVSRICRWLSRRNCGHCGYFDHEEGVKWRHEVSHKFDDGSTKAMNDDILKMSAEQANVPALADKDIGYCPKMERIVGRKNRPCEAFKRN